jgi:6-phosphogluconolactonase
MKRLLLLVAATALAVVATAAAAGAGSDTPGAVYTLTNSPAGNAVAVFARAADGSLTPAGTYATGGLGTGAGLGSQGSIVVSGDGRYVLAVNAASDTVSAFAADRDGLELLNTVPSGGDNPTSVTERRGVVYVLNAGSGTISGLELRKTGLTPLAGSTRALSAGAAVPSQIQFSRHGSTLVVTERGSNTIDTFAVDDRSYASAPVSTPSTGSAPFGFDFDNHDHLIVSDANAGPGESAATSYALEDDGGLSVVTGPVLTHQAAACWLVVSKDGRYAYTANAGSGSISRFALAPDGGLELLGSTQLSATSHPLDETVTENGRFLYVVVDGLHELQGFRIAQDGSLEPVAAAGGLPAGAAGIAAR